MAYSLPSFSAAANYAAYFKPVKPVEGFENVKSDEATKLLTAIPGRNQEASLQMGLQALQEKGDILRQKVAEDGALERLRIERDAIATENDKTRKANKRTALLRNLQSTGGLTAATGVAPMDAAAVKLSEASKFKPLQDLSVYEGLYDNLTGRAAQRNGEVEAVAAKAVQALGNIQLPSTPLPESIAKPSAVAAPQPQALAPIDSGGIDLDELKALMERFEKDGGA